jgi:O-antigen/teichoic acid export membrane protein
LKALDQHSPSESPNVTNSQSGFLHKVAVTLGTRGIGLVLMFASSVITSRYLRPEGRGVYAVLTVISGIAIQFGNFGLHAANTFFLGQNRSLRGKIVTNSAWISGIAGLILICLLIPLQSQLWNPGAYPSWVYYAAIANIPFGLFYLFAMNIRLGLGQVGSFNATELFVNVAGFVAVFICLVGFGLGPGSLIAYSTLFNAAASVWLFINLRIDGSNRFDFPLFSSMCGYGSKAYIAAMLSFLVLRLDMLMVSRMAGTGAAGIYSIAVQIADVLYLLPVSIGTVLFPQISAMTSGVWPFTKRTARVTALLMGVSCLTVWFIGPAFIQAAYGAEYRQSAAALRWLLPGIWVLGVNTIYMNYFAGTGMPLIVVISPAIALLVNLGLNIVLIPRMGVSGASFASTIAYFIMLICSGTYLFFHRKSA